MPDLSSVSTEDLLAYKRGELSKVSTEGLLAIKASGASKPKSYFADSTVPDNLPSPSEVNATGNFLNPPAKGGPAFAPPTNSPGAYRGDASGSARNLMGVTRGVQDFQERTALENEATDAAIHKVVSPVTAIIEPGIELYKRQQPGGDLYLKDVPADEAANTFVKSAGATAMMSTPHAAAATMALSTAPSSVLDAAMYVPRKAGEAVTERTGSKTLGTLTEFGVPLLVGAGAHRLLKGGRGGPEPSVSPVPVEDRGTVVSGPEAVKIVRAREQVPAVPEVASEPKPVPAPEVQPPAKAKIAQATEGHDTRWDEPSDTIYIRPEILSDSTPVGKSRLESTITHELVHRAWVRNEIPQSVKNAFEQFYNDGGDWIEEMIGTPKSVLEGTSTANRYFTGYAEPVQEFAARYVERAKTDPAFVKEWQGTGLEEILNHIKPNEDQATLPFDQPPATPPVAAATPRVAEEAPPVAPESPPTPTETASGEGTANAAGATGRDGPTLGVGLGGLGKDVEGWIENIEKPYQKRIGEPVVGKVVNPVLKLLSSPERKISPEFENTILEGKATERGLSLESKKAVLGFEKMLKSLPPERQAEIGKSLSSEPADLSFLTPEQSKVVENMRKSIQDLRAREVSAGTMSPEAQAEYPQGHLKRILKPGSVTERIAGRRGGVKVSSYETAKDMFNVEIAIPDTEARELSSDLNPRYLKQQGESTLLKFTNDEAGRKARDTFLERVQEKYASARSKLSEDATREIKAGDVQQAKMFQKAQLDTPRMADLKVKTTDPIEPEVADKLFVQDPATRALVTTLESARRIGKAETLAKIAALTDEKGPVSAEPKSRAAAALGKEAAPEGMEFLSDPSGKYHELGNKFVRSDVADYVRGKFDPNPEGFFKGLSAGLMQRFKVARLLYNPRQWVRQFFSNMEFENLAGMSNWNPRWLAWKAKGLAAMREGSPYYADIVKHGFRDPSYVTEAELGLAEQQFGKAGLGDKAQQHALGRKIGNAVGSFGLTEVAPAKLGATDSALGKAFSFSDSWTKATIYVHAIEELGMTPAQAAAYVRKWTPSPESVADFVKNYSNHIIGDPWARYKAEQARINLLAMKEKPIRFSMNKFQQNFIRAAAVVGGASLMSPDEKKAIENEQGSGAIPVGRDEQGRPLTVDYRFLSTIGDVLFDTPSAVGKPGEHAVDRAVELTGIGDNPTFGIAAEQLTRRDKYGRPVNPEGTLSGAAESAGSSFAKQFIPSLATNHREKLQAAWEGKPYSPNQPVQTKPQAILDVFFGLKLTPLDAEQALMKIGRQGRGAVEDLVSDARRDAIRGETPDVQHMMSVAEAIQKDYEARAEPLNNVLKAQQKKGQ